jgi:hypothetical protein
MEGMMRFFRILSLAVLAATIAGAAEAAPRGLGSINEPRSPPAAQPFHPYKPDRGQTTYGGDPVATTPRQRPYEGSSTGGFKPYENNFKPYGSQGTLKPSSGTLGGGRF